MKIFIDPGHGGKDPGAVGNGLREKDIALAIAQNVGNSLRKSGISVIYSRTTDVYLTPSERAQAANSAGVDVFVSIHVNAAENINARGVETYSYPGGTDGAKLASSIQDHIIQGKIFTADRGTKTADFAALRETKMAAVLVELGFISNAQDAQILRDKQNNIAVAIAKGVLEYLGMQGEEAMGVIPEWKQEGIKWLEDNGFITHGRWQAQDALDMGTFGVILSNLKITGREREE